jgi:hypothetical protein
VPRSVRVMSVARRSEGCGSASRSPCRPGHRPAPSRCARSRRWRPPGRAGSSARGGGRARPHASASG